MNDSDNTTERTNTVSQTGSDTASKLAEQLEAAAKEYQSVMQSASDGDLTARMDPPGTNEDLAAIARTFNEMMDSIESTMSDVWSFSADVSNVGKTVASGTFEIEAASERAARNIQDISDRTDEQNESLEDVSSEMDNISATMEEIAASTTEVADTAREANRRGEEGTEAAENAIDSIEEVEAASDTIVEKVAELDTQIDEINEIIDVISRIADQTNLLALNANIEAARSSNENSGFEVVAEEVKSLANESKSSAKDIESIIEQSNTQVQETVTEVRETSETISKSSETIEEALEALTDTVAAVSQANDGIQEISRGVDSQAQSNERVVSELQTVTDLSGEVNQQASDVADAVTQQTNSIKTVSQQSADLHRHVQSLEETLNVFAINEWGQRLVNHCREAGIDWRQFEGTTLTVGMTEHMFTNTTEPLLGYFEDLTGINVEYEVLPETELFQKVEREQQAASAHFDAFQLGLWPASGYHYNGWVRDLNEFFTDPSLTDKEWYHMEDYPESAISAYTYGTGDLVALPFGIETYGCIAYDRPTFQKLGLDEPSTFEELRYAAKIVHESDLVDRDGIVSRGSADVMSLINWVTTFKSYGAEWLDYETRTATLNSPVGVDSLEYYTDLLTTYGPADVAQMDWFDANTTYGDGNTGMLYHTGGACGVISEEQMNRSAWIPPVAGPDGQRVVNLWQWGLGISQFSENPGAAWLFLQWATCRPMNLLVSTDQWGEGSYGHARSNWLFDHPEYQNRGQPESWVTAHEEGMKHVPSNPPPAPSHVPQNMDILREAAQAMHDSLAGKKTPKAALDDAAPAITNYAKQIPDEYL